jgi:hypothetical protein
MLRVNLYLGVPKSTVNKELCMALYDQTKGGVFKKSLLPTPKQVTFSADPKSLQDMMTKVMDQTMIDQAKVFTNTI